MPELTAPAPQEASLVPVAICEQVGCGHQELPSRWTGDTCRYCGGPLITRDFHAGPVARPWTPTGVSADGSPLLGGTR
jgi:hypothetical protein